MADARKLGVQNPQHVRLLKVTQMPTPDDPLLAAAASHTPLISSSTIGLTLRYGILIRHDFWLNRRLLAHELVHTMQYERLGGFVAFLEPYLAECLITHKYPEGPMEAEAEQLSKNLCGID